MTQNPFGFGAMGAIRPAGQTSPQKPDDPASKRARIEGVSTKLQVPANILMALDEAGESDIEGIAAQLAAATKAGRKIEDIIPPELMNRAYDIADQMYPRQAAPAPAPKEMGTWDRMKSAFSQGDSAAIMRGQDFAQDLAAQAELGLVGRGLTALKNKVHGTTETPEEKAQAIREQPKSPIYDQSLDNLRRIEESGFKVTELGDIDGIGSAINFITDNLAQSLPQMGAAIAAGPFSMPLNTVLLGAEANEEMKEKTPDLPEAERVRIASGAGLAMASLEAIGLGAIFGRSGASDIAKATVSGKLTELLAKRGIKGSAARVIQAGIIEGSTEAIQEGIVMGAAAASGGQYTVEEVAERLATAAAAGGSVGATLRAGAEPFAQPPRQEELPNPGADGSGAGQITPPDMAPPGVAGGVIDNPPLPPAGPIERAAAAAPDLTPLPEVEPVEPPPMFPDQKPGAMVRLMDPETGEIIEGVFQREEGGDAIVRINGEEVDIAPQFFDEMLAGARQADLEAEAAAKGGKGAKKAPVKPAGPTGPTGPTQPSEQPAPPVVPGVDDAAAEALPEKGFNDGDWNAPAEGGLAAQAQQAVKPPAEKRDPLDGISAQEAAKRLAAVEERIRKANKPGKKLTDLRDRLKAIVGDTAPEGINEPNPQSPGASGIEPAGENQADQPAGGRGAAQPSLEGGISEPGGAAVPGDVETGVDAGAKPEPKPALADAPDSAFSGDLESSLGAVFFADDGADSTPLRNRGFTDEEVSALERAGLATNGQMSRKQWSAWMDERSLRLSGGRKKPRAPVAPITTAPEDRIQPDMLGGAPTTETEMAAKERRRKEWGRVLGIADNRSESEETLEGRDVLIRPKKIVIRAEPGKASDLDFTIDIEGMSRDEIATALRGGLQTLDRIAPKPKAAPAARDGQNSSEIRQNSSLPEKSDTSKGDDAAAVSRYLGSQIDREKDKLKRARADGKGAKAGVHEANIRRMRQNIWKAEEGIAEAIAKRDFSPFAKHEADFPIAAVELRSLIGKLAPQAAPVPTPAEIKAEAAKADKNPSDAQKEAGNYQMGHVRWNGLDITLETAKGTMRRGKDKDGEEWSVKMPAHYGYIKRTTGADGDHLDIYMGPNPESPSVFVVDQVDADTGRFDEHKLMLGFVAREDAQAAYYDGFSDGRGEDRMGEITQLTVDQFKAALQNSDWDIPKSIHRMKMPKDGPVYASGYLDRFRGKLRDAPSYLKNAKSKRTWEEGWDTANKHRMAPELPGAPKPGDPVTLVIQPLRGGPASEVKVPASSERPRPAIGSPEYTLIDAMNDLMDFQAEQAANGMIGDSRLESRIERQKALIKRMEAEADKPAAPAPAAETDKQKAIRLFGEIVRRGDDQQIKTARERMVSMLGEPATNRLEVEARGLKDALLDANDALPAGFSIQMQADGFALFQGETRTNVNGLSKTKAGIEEAQRQAERIGKPESGARAGVPQEGSASPIDAADAVLRENVPAPPIEAMVNNAEGGKAGNGWWKSLSDNQRFVARTFGMNGTQGKTAENWWNEADSGQRGEVLSRVRDAHGKATQGESEAPKPAPKPASGILSVLSQEKQDRAAELKAKLAAKARGQTSSGVDPEYLTLGGELVALYVEAGVKKFGQMLKDFAESTGLSMREAQAPMRIAYNHVRDTKVIEGEDISGFDTADQVMDEILAAIAAEKKAGKSPASQTPANDGNVESGPNAEGAENVDRPGQGSDPRDAGSQSEAVSPDVGEGSGDASGSRDLSAGPAGSQAEPGRDDAGLEDAGRTRGGTGARGGSGVDGGGNRPRNYRISRGGLNDTRGEKTRAKDSIEAIRLLKQIEAQGRRATPAEQEKLALYAGAGSLNPAVPNSDGSVRAGWESLASDLTSLVSKEEMDTIARTTQYAFYTSEEIVRGMWSAAQRLGFRGGNVFEPGMGIGHFLGMSPEAMQGRITYRGVELDSITARIARQLYPEATVTNQDYTRVEMPRDYFDLAIGNPPFANIEIKADKKYPQKFLLHDYFFAKTLDSVRPGGLLMFVTSEGTMNKMDSEARQYLADRADLVGAIRLPNTAFKGSAGTEVTTDVIVLRKRAEGEAAGDRSWVDVDMVSLPGLEGARASEFKVNRYFVQNPSMILGKQGGFGTQRFRGQYAVVPNEGENLADAFAEAVKRLPAGVMTDPAFDPTQAPEAVDPDSGQVKAGSFYVKDGALWQYDGSVGRKVKRRGAEGGTMTAIDHKKAMQFVAIRDALRDVYAGDLSGDTKAADAARKALNAAYDAFVAEHGPINKAKTQHRRPAGPAMERARATQREEALEQGKVWDEGTFDPTPYIDATMIEDAGDDPDAPSGPMLGEAPKATKRYSWAQIARMRKEAMEAAGSSYNDGSFDRDAVPDIEIVKRENLSAFMDDPEVWRLAALEKYDTDTGTGTKTKVFSESVLARQEEPKIQNAKDGLNYSMGQRGYPDLELIAEKADMSLDAVIAELDGLIFMNPATGRWENRDVYLSGNVRRKLKQARDIGTPDMARNIAELEKVLPRDLTEYEVTATLGMPWIPTKEVQNFAKSIGMTVVVERASAGGKWSVAGESRGTESTVTWGTEDRPFPSLLENVLNRTVIKISRTTRDADGKETTTLDEAATQAANEKADAIRDAFSKWIWADDTRKENLLRIYNDRFNSTVAPTFDGSYLTTPGIAKGWSWRPHQMRAIARILQSGSTYLAHAVGAGKTSEMIAAAMEARRLGIARKPMFTVPNHMLGQFATEFYEHYPNANILVADDRRFHTDRRRQFIADAAANDYDAIILTHSSFQKIAVSDALNDEFVQSEIERFDEAIRDSRANGDRITTKEMERAKERLEQRLRGNATDKARVDAQMTFEEMGVDMLFVDEAHLFRKLDFATQLGSLKGITPSGSKMAWDLFLKTRHLDRVNPGRGVVLASGTPITNTMAELHTISRYIQHDTLEEQGLLDFDSWAQSYGETAIDYEPDAAGNYKAVSRFSKFVNTRDLSLMVRERMDTVIPEDLEKYVVRPKLKGGGRTAVPVPRSPAVEAYQGELADRMAALEERKGPPQKGDDNHLVVIGDGIAAATDMRLIDPNASGRDSKLTRLAENLLKIWKETADTPFHKPDPNTRSFSKEPAMRGPAAQMVFADIQRRPGKSPFDTHEFIRDYLIRNGVPAEQIALFRDFKNTEAKRRLFRRVNDGEVRVLIGSAKAMGTGVNAQKRLIAMHNLDPHWYPALDEQRVGRILRQGNWNPEIQVFDYATEGTYDSTMWQMMGRKARTIEDFLRGDPNINEMEDVGPASVFEQLAGMTTPDPRILRLKELTEEVKKLGRRRANIAAERRSLVNKIQQGKESIEWAVGRAKAWEAVADKYVDLRGDQFKAMVGKTEFTDRTEFGDALNEAAKAWAEAKMGWPTTKLGEVNGSPIMISDVSSKGYQPRAINLEVSGEEDLGGKTKSSYISALLEVRFSKDAEASVSLYENPMDTAKSVSKAVHSIPESADYYRSQEAGFRKNLANDEKALADFKGFTDGPLLAAKEEELDALRATLDKEEEARQAAKKPAQAAPAAETDSMEMREGRAPVATLRGDELGAWEDVRQLARKAEAWYRDNLIGASVVNQSSGMEISFTKAAAKKLSGRKGDVLYRAVPALRAILEKGEVITVTPETKGRKHIKAWHAVSATVMLEGKPRDVIAHVMETADGNFHYDLSRDMGDGARFMREGAETSITDNRYGLEDNPADLNLEFSPARIKSPAGWGEVEADPPITEDDIRGITREMNAELARTGLAGKINVRVTRDLIGKSGRQIQGMFGFSAATGRPGIQVRAGAPAGERGVMRHEIIHALRSEKLWNKPFGLFTGAEWRELARAARAEPEIVASVMERYPEASREMQTEEMVAELYRLWAAQRDTYGGVERTLAKIEAFLQAMANLLRGKGFVSAARTMEQIAGGRIGGRGPQGPGGGGKRGGSSTSPIDGAEMRAIPGTVRDKFKGLVGFRSWQNPSEWARNTMTDAVTSGKMSLLALVPGRALFAELGKNIMSAKRYLRAKEEMDALRNEWHSKAAETAQKWMEMQKKDPAANDAMMDLMHRSTLSGVDPSQPDTWGLNNNLLKSAKEEISKSGDAAPDWAKSMLDHEKKRKTTYATVKQMYDALPSDYQAFYVEVKNAYEALANDFDKALEDNIKNAARIALKRAEKEHRKEMRRIKDEGLTGVERDEAVDAADKALAKVKKRAQMGVNTRIKSLRKTFESQRLKGPYFPLARFGKYFVTVRDENGRVTNFSRFENERAQQAFVREQEADNPGRVTFGLMEDTGLLRDQVDPKFVADIEMMLADTGASPELMDSIWQRYLETMPDQSIRTSKIHRKGREGFNRDALRSFTSHTFHGAHQLARLKYGIELQDAMEDAMDEARRSDDPNRATALVNEMNRRMEWTMNPTGSSLSAGASSLAFVWYLGVSPAAALVNISQTTILGPALMKAAFRKASIGKITGELARAAKDFSQGRGTALGDLWRAENAPGLTDNERAALAEGYRRGTIDKTQAHDLAAVAESGVEFNPRREKWMRRIGFFFHHAERFNREVAFLANYRLAREDGMSHDDAIEKAADLTWKIHFSYQNSDRPRFMQDDIPKVIFIFRQFSTNMLYRLFRDTHQALKGATAADRAEAKTQLIGITLSMLAHAGVRGVWGYSLLMGLLSIFFPGDSDDLEDFIHDALLMEGDGLDVAAWNYAMGAVLNGVPGQITGIALTERIGMPDLWFRSPNRDLEGQDAYHYWLSQIAGPIGGIGSSLFMAAQSFGDAAERGDASMAVRGIEQAVPKFVRDIIRAGRYGVEGVQTRNGDALIESVSPIDVIVQANGFTPAKVSERYRVNNLLKNREKRVLDQRKALHRSAGDAIRDGKAIPPRIIERIREFNREFPEYPITSDTIRQSVQGRIRASNRNEFGISLNPKLNDRLRREVAPTIYN